MTPTPSDGDFEKAREIVNEGSLSTYKAWDTDLVRAIAQALSERTAEMQGEVERLKAVLDFEKKSKTAAIKRATEQLIRANNAETALSQRAEEIATALIESAQGHEHLKGLASKDGDRESALVHSSNAAILRLEAQAIRTRYAREG